MIFSLSNEGMYFFIGFDIMLIIWFFQTIFDKMIYDKRFFKPKSFNPQTRINDVGGIDKLEEALVVPLPPKDFKVI